MAAFAATALPGAAAAQEHDRSILLPLAGGLGTANWFLRPSWTKTFKIGKSFKVKHVYKGFNLKPAYNIAGPKFAATAGPKFSLRHIRHHKKKVGSASGEFPFMVGAIWCSAASPIITVLIEQRELSNQEVIDSTIGCFFPPYALFKMFSQ